VLQLCCKSFTPPCNEKVAGHACKVDGHVAGKLAGNFLLGKYRLMARKATSRPTGRHPGRRPRTRRFFALRCRVLHTPPGQRVTARHSEPVFLSQSQHGSWTRHNVHQPFYHAPIILLGPLWQIRFVGQSGCAAPSRRSSCQGSLAFPGCRIVAQGIPRQQRLPTHSRPVFRSFS